MKLRELDIFYMQIALKEAYLAKENGDIPCGAIIVLNNQIIAKAHNQVELLNDPTAHAEILAITQAANTIKNWRLKDCVMYVTKEPCVMCSGAIVSARIKRVVWAMTDQKCGGMSKFNILSNNDLNHKVIVEGGILENESKKLIQRFFSKIRKKKEKSII